MTKESLVDRDVESRRQCSGEAACNASYFTRNKISKESRVVELCVNIYYN